MHNHYVLYLRGSRVAYFDLKIPAIFAPVLSISRAQKNMFHLGFIVPEVGQGVSDRDPVSFRLQTVVLRGDTHVCCVLDRRVRGLYGRVVAIMPHLCRIR